MAPPDPERPRRRPLPARLLGIGARGAGRVAEATGIDDAVERTTEEAIVRALESPAVERALIRVLEGPAVTEAVERALASPAVERTVVEVLDSELVDRVWERLLASDEAQKLVERIAEAPEVRNALASQGVGLIEDVGRQIRRVADRLDDVIERVAHRLSGRPPRAEATHRVGFVTRALATLIDGAILNGLYLVVSAIAGVTISDALGEGGEVSAGVIAVGATLWLIAGSFYLGFFWAVSGQTPGMRFLSIHLDADGTRRIGTRRAVRRLLGTLACVLTLGIGFLAVAVSERRRTLADQIAGTDVLRDDSGAAPWAD
jgi:uncharacterized RDD family membrane protein YckC